KPHRTSSGQRATNLLPHCATLASRRSPAVSANRTFPGRPHPMTPRPRRASFPGRRDFSLCGRSRWRSKVIFFAVFTLLAAAIQLHSAATQSTPKKSDPPIPVKFTDIRKQAGIVFLQDSTQTEEKL